MQKKTKTRIAAPPLHVPCFISSKRILPSQNWIHSHHDPGIEKTPDRQSAPSYHDGELSNNNSFGVYATDDYSRRDCPTCHNHLVWSTWHKVSDSEISKYVIHQPGVPQIRFRTQYLSSMEFPYTHDVLRTLKAFNLPIFTIVHNSHLTSLLSILQLSIKHIQLNIGYGLSPKTDLALLG